MVAYVQPVELYYDGDWHVVTDDVRDDIAINRGKGPDTPFAPSSMACTVDNLKSQVYAGSPDEVYSPLNTNSPLYGKIGSNTPIRMYYRVILDDFGNRTVGANGGWGTTAAGLIWIDSSAGESVSGGVGIHTISTAPGTRRNVLPTALRDCEVRTKVTPQTSDITGAAVHVGVAARYISNQNHYKAVAEIGTDESITLRLYVVSGGVDTELDSFATSITFSGQALMVALLAEGPVIAAKVWEASAGEPLHPQVVVADTTHGPQGWGTVFSVASHTARLTSNTNANFTAHYDDFEVRSYRFTGEIERWPQRSNVDDSDVWVPIKAFDISRRVIAAGGRTPVRSALSRALSSASPLAHWALAGAGTLTAGVGSDAVLVQNKATGFGRFDMAPWLEAGTQLDDGSTLTCAGIVMDSSPSGFSVDFLFAGSEADTVITFRGANAAVGIRFRLTLIGGAFDELDLEVFEDNSEVGQITTLGLNEVNDNLPFFNGVARHVRVTAEQDGSDTNWSLYIDGSTTEGAMFTSLGGGSLSSAASTTLTIPNTDLTACDRFIVAHSDVPIGLKDVVVWDESPLAIANAFAAFAGHLGETAAERIPRLADEEGFTVLVPDVDTEALGRQRLIKPIELMLEAAEVDGGILTALRGLLAFVYLPFNTLYGQSATLVLDYTNSGQVGHPLNATDDTAHLANDYTVARRPDRTESAGESTAVKTTGWNNTSEPVDDPKGVGRYPRREALSIEADTQTGTLAARRLRIAAWPDSRYESVVMRPDANTVFSQVFLAMLDLSIGDRLQVENGPDRYGADPIDQLVRGLLEDPRDNTWRIEANTVPAGPYLTKGLLLPGTTGEYASTPDAAALDITGRLWLAIEATVADWTPSAVKYFLSKYTTTGDQRAYALRLDAAGTISVIWSITGDNFLTASSTVAPAVSDGERLAFAVDFDPDNGSGRVALFYVAPSIDGPWMPLGAPVTGAATSIFSSTAPLEVGSNTSGAAGLWAGTAHAAQVRDGGRDGVIVVDVRFQEQPPGTTSFTDDAGKAWTVHGTAAIV